MITTVTSVQRFATKTLYTRARATDGSTMLAPMSLGAGKGLTPSQPRDTWRPRSALAMVMTSAVRERV